MIYNDIYNDICIYVMIYNVHIFDDHDVLKSSLTRLRTSGRAGFNCNLAAFQPDTVSRASEFW